MAAARMAAGKAFDVAIRFPPGAAVRVPPWTRASLVKAEPIADQRYEAHGPTQILEPTF
jgi:hypothetical protein